MKRLKGNSLLRLLFVVFFVHIFIDGYIFSIIRKTKIFLVSVGPAAEGLGGHRLNMNDKKKVSTIKSILKDPM